MYNKTVQIRKVNKRMKLTKKIVEQYVHSDLSFFPKNFKFDRPVILPTAQVLINYSTILLTKDCYFVVLESIFKMLSDDLQKLTKKNKCIIFQNEFIKIEHENGTENENGCDINSNIKINSIIRYLKKLHPNIEISILDESNINEYANRFQLNDILINDCFVNEDIFPAYLDNLEYLHKTGKVSKGTIMISAMCNQEGEIVETNKRTRVRGLGINRAMHGDEVYVKDEVVVGIYKRKHKIVVGTLYEINNNIAFIRPLDRRIPDIKALTMIESSSLNRKVIVDVKEWKPDSALPRGIIYKILGENANFEDEVKAIMIHYEIDYFEGGWANILRRYDTALNINTNSKGISAEDLGFNKAEFSIESAYAEIKNNTRKDLRHLQVCSIDPIGCTDIDDALHCTMYKDYIEVGVHIADVSLYVKEGSPLDEEAKLRSTTVYFPDRRIDMLPPFLSADLCSLKANEDRAAFSCIWKLNSEYEIIETEICRSVIRSTASLSYEEAHSIINNNKNNSLETLLKIATKLRTIRFENGALELNSSEIYIDANKSIKIKESIPTHYLVEEFMLLANISIAKFIHKHNPEYALLRKHPLPSAIDLDIVDCSSSKSINKSLKLLDPEISTIAKRIITRSMQQAIYFVSGESCDFYHYGLATQIYTHFTSPIRRYPDILVHRTLAYILNNQDSKIDQLSCCINRKNCSFMNFRHRNAQNASRMVNELYLFKSIENKILNAVVVSVRESGCAVFIREYGIEEFIFTDQKFNVFDKLNVKIDTDFENYCINRKLTVEIV